MTERTPFGLLVVDKPAGPTSHDVVAQIRRATGVSKVGHTGTLDPAATGVLVLCLGQATRLSEYLTQSDKRYSAEIHFGRTTTTYDAEGDIVEETGRSPSREAIESALPGFLGELQQRPPDYSAIKVGGVPAYRMARQGQSPDLSARRVIISDLQIEAYDPPVLGLEVACSAGTYIRSLAHDLGQALGVGAYLGGLRRLQAGAFDVSEAVPLADLLASVEAGDWERFLRDPAEGLPSVPRVQLENGELESVRHGRSIAADEPASGLALALDGAGRLVAVLQAEPDGDQWHPDKVFLG